MSTHQTIESHDKSIADLLGDFYVVPEYQREYVWEDQQINQLFDDIQSEFSSGENPLPEYFIGSIVVCRGEDGRFDLIDGQQRLTTLYVLICAIRDHLQSRQAPVPGQLGALISAASVDAEGNDVFRYRVELQYEDSGDALVAIANGDSMDLVPAQSDTRSIANLRNAYRLGRDFLDREFVDDDQGVRRFYVYLTQRVKLIRISTQSVAHALKIFETINDRGKGLDSMDLLKNLMFMQVNARDFAKLKDRWKKLVDTLYQASEKPLRFLRYFIFATYDVERLKEEEIYGWFVANKALCGYEAKPLQFVDALLEAARAYQHFSQGQDATGAPNRYLQNIRMLSGAARQHFILLLAGRHLPLASFAELVRQLENLLFIFIITRENTREFERNFARWSKELRTITSAGALSEWLGKRFEPEKRRLATRFELTMRDLDLSLLQKYRQRYLLAKMTQHVDEQGFGTGTHPHLDAYLKGVDIEHVLPQTPSAEALTEFGTTGEEARRLVHRLGNLVLVERPVNGSVGNRPYSSKRHEYPKSKFLLTRTIATKVFVGVNTTVNKAVGGFSPFETWSPTAIAQRQAMLAELARRVWEVPTAEGSSSIPTPSSADASSTAASATVTASSASKAVAASASNGSGEAEVGQSVIRDAIGLSARDVAGRRVLCPACGEKTFDSWPAGWDSHAAHVCSGLTQNTPADRKAEFRDRFANLFRDGRHIPESGGQRAVMRDLYARFAPDEDRVVREYAAAEKRGQARRSSNAYDVSAEDYARRLLADGLRKGWLNGA